MSERNGDRARYRKNRGRKLAHRLRIRALAARLLGKQTIAAAAVAVVQGQASPVPAGG